MDFTPMCPALRETGSVTRDRGRLLGLRAALSRTGPGHSCDRARGLPGRARSARPWASWNGRWHPGACTGVPRSPRPQVSPVCHPQARLLQQLPWLQTRWVTRPARAVLPYWRPLRSVPLSREASRSRTRNCGDPASATCRRTSRSCCGTSRQHCLPGS